MISSAFPKNPLAEVPVLPLLPILEFGIKSESFLQNNRKQKRERCQQDIFPFILRERAKSVAGVAMRKFS